MHMNKLHTLVILVVALFLASCGDLAVWIELPPPTGLPSDTVQASGEISEGPPTLSPTAELEPVPTLPPTETAIPEFSGSKYWRVQEYPGLGLRFAVPCYWQVENPTEAFDPEKGAYFNAINYTQEYLFSFPRRQIPPENGAVSVSFDIINLQSYDLPPGSSLREFVNAETSDDYAEILEIVDVEINGQPAISATIEYKERNSVGRYFLIKLNDEFFLRFSVAPSPKILNTPDLEGILNSITIDPEAEVVLPTHLPAPPPKGLAAPCIPDYAEADGPAIELSENNTPCGLDSFKSLEFVTLTVQQYLQDRNTGGLRWDWLIHDPFVVGYWGSESTAKSADMFSTELANSFYAAGEPGGMSFTTDRSAFPPLAGTPPENMLPPDAAFVQVIYSEGWGLDKMGAALLYFAEDECGGFYWHGLVISSVHFDQ